MPELCEDCDRYHCPECSADYADAEDADRCCAEADYEDEGYGRSGEDESADHAAEVPKVEVPAILLPVLDGRAPRLVSIEQETQGDTADPAMRELERLGIAVSRRASQSEVSAAPGGRKIYVTSDPTCGLEVTYSRLQLHTLADAAILGQGVETVRDHARIGMDCGFHVHVSARTLDSDARWLSQDAVIALRESFTLVESLLYRLAAARWSDHRGGEYCLEGPDVLGEQLKGRKLSMLTHSRYHGLNPTPYLAAREHCSCAAARWGVWGECECDLYGCPTVEFRLWNATLNPTKVRAYVALSHALVDHAEAISTGDAAPFDNGGLGVQFDNLTRLPLDAQDRAAVAYCARYSDLDGYLRADALSAFEGGRS